MATLVTILAWVGAGCFLLGFISCFFKKMETETLFNFQVGTILIVPSIMGELHLLPQAAWLIMPIMALSLIPTYLRWDDKSKSARREKEILRFFEDGNPHSIKEVHSILPKMEVEEIKNLLEALTAAKKLKKIKSRYINT
jgi:hypothetical protein